ncbi:MAG TPA: hypothetical protein VHX90_04530 [Verrucomicrobiae bacterium]|jgi:hypothetical protein|nr:hypothetical protein [Verrucomicrobiae bacterium]
MKKVALVFVLAVLLPSLVLAWLALRSQRDQQFLLERQQSLLYQRVTDALATDIANRLAQQQQEFSAQVETLAAGKDAREVAAQFDSQLRQSWPLAEVGFCVTLSGKILSPAANARDETKTFYTDNSGFLGNRETAEVYGLNGNANPVANDNGGNGRAGANQSVVQNNFSGVTEQKQSQQALAFANSAAAPSKEKMESDVAQNSTRSSANQSDSLNSFSGGNLSGRIGGGGFGGGGGGGRSAQNQSQRTLALAPAAALPPQQKIELDSAAKALPEEKINSDQPQVASVSGAINEPQQSQSTFNYKSAQARKISPQSDNYQTLKDSFDTNQNNLSRVIPAEAEFAQLVGDGTDGMLARFLQNKLNLMFWHRLNREPDLIFGAQLNLSRVVDGLRDLVQPEPALQNEICLALLDDSQTRRDFARKFSGELETSVRRHGNRRGVAALGNRRVSCQPCAAHAGRAHGQTHARSAHWRFGFRHWRRKLAHRHQPEFRTETRAAEDRFRQQRLARTQNTADFHPHVFRIAR